MTRAAQYLRAVRCALFTVFHPSYWMMNHPYSRRWDTILRDLLARGKYEKPGNFTWNVGGISVWVENHPYASFQPEEVNIRPSRLTIHEARKVFLAAHFVVDRDAKLLESMWSKS